MCESWSPWSRETDDHPPEESDDCIQSNVLTSWITHHCCWAWMSERQPSYKSQKHSIGRSCCIWNGSTRISQEETVDRRRIKLQQVTTTLVHDFRYNMMQHGFSKCFGMKRKNKIKKRTEHPIPRTSKKPLMCSPPQKKNKGLKEN